MSKYLDPKADLTFKKVFGEHENLVLSLLNALLPLPEDMEIKSVSYLPTETIPESPAKKYSIVDVRCTDNFDRTFIVEMQSYWNAEFFSRTLFNAASTYSNQLVKGNAFKNLQDVYALSLINDTRGIKHKNEYMQEFYLINKNHPEEINTSISLIFIHLPKFKPTNLAQKKMHDLWLKFLTQVDEQTTDAAPELLENNLTNEALEIVERSAYTASELAAYNKYWLDVSTEKSALEREREKGRVEGREEGHAEGKAEGEKSKAFEIAKSLKNSGVPLDIIVGSTGLTKDEIEKI